MRASRPGIRFVIRPILLAMLSLMLPGAAGAQDVLSNGDFPFNWAFPFAPDLDDAAVRINQGNVTGATGSNFTVGGNSRDVRLQVVATVTEDGNAVRDRFRFTLGANQEFEVVDAAGANLWAPMYLRGAITFFQNAVAPNANFAVGSITATVEFRQWNGAAYVALNDATLPAPAAAALTLSRSLDRDAQVNPAGGNIDEIALLRFDNAPAARYQLQLRLTVTGESDNNFAGNSNVGSGTTVRARAADANDRYSGAITGLGYAPAAALPDSRDTVQGPAARADYGVDGTGSRIGLLEPGRVIDTHTAFGGGKVTQLRQRLDLPAGLTNAADANSRVADGRSEHTTAVGGIAAGNAGNDAQKGIAPGADLVSVAAEAYVDDPAGPGAKTGGQKQFDALLGASTIINMSAFFGNLPATYVDQQIAANPLVTFVKSAGNSGIAGAGANTITNPGLAHNMITVGAVRQDMTRTGAFSSTNNTDNSLRKPDIVAPGDYVIIPNAIDTNVDGVVNDFDRRFTGSDARYHDAATTTGGASGTSFAAPHVSGTVALLQDYRRRHPGTHDVDSVDHRVLKAVLQNTANRTAVSHDDGAAWSQDRVVLGGIVTVRESLDRQLGAGLLDARGALKNFAAGEIRAADGNAEQSFRIFAPVPPPGPGPDKANILSRTRTEFWDFERVAPAQVGPPPAGETLLNGTVDYILGSETSLHFIAEVQLWAGTVMPNFTSLSAALTWDRLTNAGGTAYEDLANLELRIYLDGLEDGNVPGFDPAKPDADRLLARTDSLAENVKLLTLDQAYLDANTTHGWKFNTIFGSLPPTQWDPRFYLEVVNLSSTAPVDYGLSVSAVFIPEPSSTALLVMAGWIAAARLRRRDR